MRASQRQPREEDPLKPEQLERENERLSREVERLRQELIERDKKIVELERKLALRLQNSTTSSKPPSSDGLAGEQRPRGSRGKKSRRKPGGQPGHRGHWRGLAPLSRVDQVIEVFPPRCRHCNSRLSRRMAHEWKVIDRLPKIRLLQGERTREFVLSREQEPVYLNATPQPLKDLALLMLDTGLRDGEALALRWPDVHMQPAPSAKFGYLQVQKGKSVRARRTVSLTARVQTMLAARPEKSSSEFVFPGRSGKPMLVTSLDHLHAKVRESLKMPADFVVHSLRHTMLTRLGMLGVDAFTIMKIAGHSSITISQRYVHPSPESVERAFEKLEVSNQLPARIGVGIELGIGGKNAVQRNRRKIMK